jgi:hypothetical protein
MREWYTSYCFDRAGLENLIFGSGVYFIRARYGDMVRNEGLGKE